VARQDVRHLVGVPWECGPDCGIPDNTRMSDTTASPLLHLLVPGAGLPRAGDDRPAGQAAAPALPQLQSLLARMQAVATIALPEDSLSMPHEIALARLNGLPDTPGQVPWAAFECGVAGSPCAWIKPCHWRVGADHVLLGDPDELALNEEASRALLAAAAPYFAEDGITLQWRMPGAWLALGEVFRGLPTLSLERAVGQRLTPEMFETSARHSPVLRRLQNEMQMLFYTHPVNDARQARGLAPVNSFWIAGAGTLDAPPALPAPGIQLETRLQPNALRHDAAAHAAAWQAVDADACARLLAALQAGQDVRLTLCGTQRAVTYAPAAPGLLQRAARLFSARPDVSGVLAAL
jgi:hypothetical protein